MKNSNPNQQLNPGFRHQHQSKLFHAVASNEQEVCRIFEFSEISDLCILLGRHKTFNWISC